MALRPQRNGVLDDSLEVVTVPIWDAVDESTLFESLRGQLAVLLDLHEGISTPEVKGCPRWPEQMRLKSSRGELVRGRCRATNQCDYCAKLGAVENAEMLALDALEGVAPSLYVVLTTRQAITDPKPFYAARRKVFKALQRRWPDVEYAALVEFTTGKGEASGGLRRPHWNLLLKGIPREDERLVADVVRDVWCNHPDVDAKPEAQWIGTVDEVGGLMRYLALHFRKQSQSPPEGWRGHRFSASRGYLWMKTPLARAASRTALREKREVWKARKAGYEGEAAEAVAKAKLELAAATEWALVTMSDAQLRAEALAGSGQAEPHVSRARSDLPAAIVTQSGKQGDASFPALQVPKHVSGDRVYDRQRV